MEAIYATELGEIGAEADEFLAEGMLILFEAGGPPELAEISVAHRPTTRREAPPVAGDVLAIGDTELRITAVGDKAWENMLKIGHATFKFNGASEAELPGEICVEAPASGAIADRVRPGARFELRAA